MTPGLSDFDAQTDGAGTLADRVYRHLAGRLVAGRLAPGEKLSLRGIADSLGVSMMPVREAMSRLAAERALLVAPKRAVTVPLMGAAGFRDITRVRVEIEGVAAAMAAEACDAAGMADIEACEMTFRAISMQRAPDLSLAVSANQAFHFAVYRAACSAELLAIIERLWLRVGPIINFDLLESPDRLRSGGAVRYHQEVVEAIRRRDGAAARTALAADIAGAAQFILSQNRLPD